MSLRTWIRGMSVGEPRTRVRIAPDGAEIIDTLDGSGTVISSVRNETFASLCRRMEVVEARLAVMDHRRP